MNFIITNIREYLAKAINRTLSARLLMSNASGEPDARC